MISAEKLRETIAERADCPLKYLRNDSLVSWHRVATALEKLLAAEPEAMGQVTVGQLLVELGEGRSIGDIASDMGLSVEKLSALLIIEQSRPAVCGPTADEVWAVWHNPQTSKRDVFAAWYESRVIPINEVTGPLEERQAALEKEAKTDGIVIRKGIDNGCKLSKELVTTKERIAELEADVIDGRAFAYNMLGTRTTEKISEEQKDTLDEQLELLNQYIKSLESQLAERAFVANEFRKGCLGKDEIVDGLQKQLATAKADYERLKGKWQIEGHEAACQNARANHLEKELAAAKPLDWKNMAINERLEAVGCRPTSGLVSTLHADDTFSIEADKPPCYTEEEMRVVVAKMYKEHGCPQTAIDLEGTETPSSQSGRIALDTIRALAGHVADQTARLKRQGSQCIHAAIIGNDTNQYESVPEMLADLIREHCDERGQEIHRLCGIIGERNKVIREQRAEIAKGVSAILELRGVIEKQAEIAVDLGMCVKIVAHNDCPERREKEAKPEPKPEWPKWFFGQGDNTPDVCFVRFDSATGPGVGYYSDGSLSQTWEWVRDIDGFVEFWGHDYHPIPGEPEAVRKWEEENAKPTERYWAGPGAWDSVVLWKWDGEIMQLHKPTKTKWEPSILNPSDHSDCEEISPAKADAIQAGWKKQE